MQNLQTLEHINQKQYVQLIGHIQNLNSLEIPILYIFCRDLSNVSFFNSFFWFTCSSEHLALQYDCRQYHTRRNGTL